MSPISTPVLSLPSKTATGKISVKVEVVPMTQELVAKWNCYVQPLIRDNYVEVESPFGDAFVRADKEWDWEENFQLLVAHNCLCETGAVAHGEAMGMCLVIKYDDSGDKFPIGMLIAVPQFYCNVQNKKHHRGFTWFLADAPDELYSDVLEIPIIDGVATSLLNCSITATLDSGLDGELLLKADPMGGGKLIAFYSKWGMMQLPEDHPPISRLRKKELERYFYFDATRASAFSADLANRCRKLLETVS